MIMKARLNRFAAAPQLMQSLQIDDGRIVGIYVMRNPDKLRHLGGMTVH
jgi:hypothetical protein